MREGDAGAPSHLLGHATRVASAVGALLVLALLLLIDADILGRELLGASLRGVVELAGLAVVALLFLELPETVRAGRLPRAEPLLARLARSRPRAAAGLDVAAHLAGAVALLLLAASLVPPLLEAWHDGLYVGAAGDFTAPLWPIRLIMLLGALLGAAQFAHLARRRLAAGRG